VVLYVGTVHILLKYSIFQASSPTRHTTELGRLMKQKFPSAVAVVMYTEGGPDHNCKHTSIRLGRLSLFLELDLDTMVVMHTAPTQSLGNPVERVMSVLNLCLQGVALAREEMCDVYEKQLIKCNGMSSVRRAAEAYEVTSVKQASITEELHPQLKEQQLLLQEEELQDFLLHENHMLEEEELLRHICTTRSAMMMMSWL